ncbi:General transcription factor II-I repeat domain-containing protein 2A [Eumeta japonica]|uniref:General transcription factor II-I repeat domain-containing protein 2A n=1 Tax=Eumeta variegata TaxID=151549 RepID=A0A4C1W3L8_EUMVA|nr:General transcription factor II-I repeat domain-containing protein 2A [Eumeta japonica]
MTYADQPASHFKTKSKTSTSEEISELPQFLKGQKETLTMLRSCSKTPRSREIHHYGVTGRSLRLLEYYGDFSRLTGAKLEHKRAINCGDIIPGRGAAGGGGRPGPRPLPAPHSAYCAVPRKAVNRCTYGQFEWAYCFNNIRCRSGRPRPPAPPQYNRCRSGYPSGKLHACPQLLEFRWSGYVLADPERHELLVLNHPSITLDERTDLSDTAQPAIFIRGVHKEFTVTEELLAFQPLKGTSTVEEIFNEVQKRATAERSGGVVISAESRPLHEFLKDSGDGTAPFTRRRGGFQSGRPTGPAPASKTYPACVRDVKLFSRARGDL